MLRVTALGMVFCLDAVCYLGGRLSLGPWHQHIMMPCSACGLSLETEERVVVVDALLWLHRHYPHGMCHKHQVIRKFTSLTTPHPHTPTA